MALKKTVKGPQPLQNLSEKQFRRIWGDVKPVVLWDKLRAIRPNNKWVVNGNIIKGCCPYHMENTPSFNIYIDRGYAKCFGCEKFIWNPVHLWADLTEVTTNEALVELRQIFGLKFLPTNALTQLKAWERNQLLKQQLMKIFHAELVEGMSKINDPSFIMAKPTIEWLINTRVLSKDVIPSLSVIGIMPPVAKILNILDTNARLENERRHEAEIDEVFVSLVNDAKEYLSSLANTSTWTGTLVFQMDVAPDVIGRFKLRKPGTKDFIIIEDKFEDSIGFFGLGWPLYKDLLGAQQKFSPRIYVVEGEFDALSTMARQVEKGVSTFVIVAAGGNAGGMHIDNLRNFGYDEVLLIGDAPDKHGDVIISNWLERIKELRAKIFIGYSNFPGCGDPDEIVLRYGLDKFQSIILDIKNKDIFQAPPEWVFEQIKDELGAIDVDDSRFKIETASTVGHLLQNRHECDAYVSLCASTFNIPAVQLKREIVAKEENEPAFILRLVDVLSTVFYVIGQRANDGDRWLYLWHKDKREIKKVGLADDRSIEQELGSVLGPPYQFFQEKVGIPSFLENPMKQESGKYLRELDNDCRWYYRQALTIMSQNAPDFDSAPHKGQGLHVIRSDFDNTPSLYLVNGRDVYFGKYINNILEWHTLEGPSHSGYVFDVGEHKTEEPWLNWIRSKEDLDEAKNIDIKDMWNKLHDVLDKGWVFKNHSVTVDFLTSHLLATTICNAFRRQVIVSFHADTSAGKSRLVMGLIGGKDFPRIHLIASAIGKASFTAAGLRQEMNNKTRPLALDEFEDEGDNGRKTRTIVETLEMLRNSVGEDNTYTLGSRGGSPQIYHLNFFVYLAAINKPRKVQDANRMIQLELQRKEGRDDPVQILLNEFGGTYLEDLKKNLSIGLIPHILNIQTVYNEIEKEFSKTGSKPIKVDTRYFEALFPALAIMKIMGRDYNKFVRDFCEINKENIVNTASHTDSSQIFDWICQTPAFVIKSEDNRNNYPATLLQMLASPEYRDLINISSTGLYYDAPSNLLIVNWTMAIQMVLARHARYAKETNVSNIRELANRGSNAIKSDELVRSGALSRLRSAGLTGVAIHHLSAFNISSLLSEMSAPATIIPIQKDKVQDDNGNFAA